MSKKLIEQFVRLIITEAIGDDPQKQTQLNDSLDREIDKFLMKADKPGAKQDEESDEDEEGEETKGSKLDVEKFAGAIARLVLHHNNLLDIPNTIVRRALNYVTTNYDQVQAQAVKESLSKEFQVGPDVLDLEYDVSAPAADRAGPTPGGAAGG